MKDSQMVDVNAWALEWLLGAAKQQLEAETNEGKKHYLIIAIRRAEKAYAEWLERKPADEDMS